ncbi:hypothetical protein C8R44DRAFT_746015 [Mycena epipterygia]|nr:hypothetical protein C8R44DRAFT_746015 [Mycena epipterygia]
MAVIRLPAALFGIIIHVLFPPPRCVSLSPAQRSSALDLPPAALWETTTTLKHYYILSWTPRSMQTNLGEEATTEQRQTTEHYAGCDSGSLYVALVAPHLTLWSRARSAGRECAHHAAEMGNGVLAATVDQYLAALTAGAKRELRNSLPACIKPLQSPPTYAVHASADLTPLHTQNPHTSPNADQTVVSPRFSDRSYWCIIFCISSTTFCQSRTLTTPRIRDSNTIHTTSATAYSWE